LAGETARPTWNSWLRRFAAVTIVAILASCGTRLWIWSAEPVRPLPSIAQGLPGNNYSPLRRAAFTERLNDRFPVGSAEFDLVRELWLEGFQPPTDSHPARRVARFEGGWYYFCLHWVAVVWGVDDSGRLTKISGEDGFDCP
jgi:hypothetical protein